MVPAPPYEFAKRLWRPCGHALGNDLQLIRAKFHAEHPEAIGELRINPPDAAGFRKLEFRGSINAKAS